MIRVAQAPVIRISEYKYLDEKGCIDEGKISAYVEVVKNQVPNYDNLYYEYMKRFEAELGGDSSSLVCGKYVFASLIQYLRNCSKEKIKSDDFKYFLISEFEIHKLDYIKEQICQVCKTK